MTEKLINNFDAGTLNETSPRPWELAVQHSHVSASGFKNLKLWII